MEIKVTITERCSARCTSCLTNTIKNPRDMTFETWKRIIDDVCDIGVVHKFHFYGFGESMIHPEIQKFLDYACPKLKAKNIHSVLTTNGSVDLTQFDLSQMNSVIVSFNAFSRKIYQEHIGLSWDNVLNNIIKIAKVRPIQVHILNYNKETDMAEDLQKVLQHKNIRGRLSNKVDNQLGEFYEDDNCAREPCSYVTQIFTFNANGDLVLCAHDFHSQIIYGNINDVSLKELYILKQKDMIRHRQNIFEGICEHCNFNKKVKTREFIKWL